MNIRLLHSNDNIDEYLDCVRDLNNKDNVLSSVKDIKYSLDNRPSNILTFILLDDNKKIVATATMIIEKKLRYKRLCCHIEDVGVHPDKRGLGYGEKIVNHCILIAKENKCYKVKLNCNESLVPFYKRLGFNKNSNGMVLESS
jgi:predicted GNAT family N-acyltransferase